MEAENVFERAFEHAAVPMAIVDGDGQFVAVNEAMSSFLGRPRASIHGSNLWKLAHPADAKAGRREMRRAARELCGSVTVETRYRRSDRGFVLARTTFSAVPSAGGLAGEFLAVIRDITEERSSAERLRELSLVDDLTGLRNRRGFKTLADHVRRHAARDGDAIVLLAMDLDDFKGINDQYGHAAGDTALRVVADLLRAAFRDIDVVARFGGDEFAALLACDVHETRTVVERLRNRFRWFNASGAHPFPLSLSIGAVVASASKELPLAEMFAEADAALYADKHRRKAARADLNASRRSDAPPTSTFAAESRASA